MRPILLQRLPLVIILALFVAFRCPYLFYPYYWDESWPYATAVASMYKNGISLLPGSIDPELSRGHPLFFHAAAATWGHIFGMSKISMHSFALTISLLFMVTIYEAGLRLFNIRVAVLGLLLICTQVVFVVQSTFLLLEMMVAFLAFISMYSYVRGKYTQTGIYLTMLFLTKESGLIMGFVLGIDALWQLRTINKNNFREHLPRLLAIAIPCLAVAGFFLLQLLINGWLIFPLYSGLIEHRWDHFWYLFSKGAVECTFISGYRGWTYIAALILSVAAAIRSKKYALATIALPIALVYFMSGKQGPHDFTGSLLHFIGLLSGTALAVHIFTLPWLFADKQQQLLIRLSIAFMFCFTIFSATNFFSYRYLMAAMIPGLFVAVVVIDRMASLTQPKLVYVAATLLLAINGYAYATDTDYGDADPGAFNAMKLQQRAIDYLESRKQFNTPIASGSFLTRVHLTDPATGFLHGPDTFTHVKYDITDSTRFIVMDNIEPDGRYPTIKASPYLKLAFRDTLNGLWTEVYERK